MELALPQLNFSAIMPETVLSVVAMALLLVNVVVKGEEKAYLGYLSLAGLVVSLFTIPWGQKIGGFGDMVLQDNFSSFFTVIFILCAGLTILISDSYFKKEGCNHGELYPLILFATVGMMFMAKATDLMTVFLGLEVLSVTLYILAGFNRANVKSNE